VTRGGGWKQEVVRQLRHSGGRGRCTAPAAEEQSVPEEEEEKGGGSEGSPCNFQKSQGSFCKVKFSVDPKP
jgi:hypothetical protein